MRLDEYAAQDATGLAELVRRGEISAMELLGLARSAVDQLNPQLNAVIAPIDPPIAGCADGPLAGVPFLIKDLVLHAQGVAQAMGSRILADGVFVSPHDSELFRRFKAAGLVTFGRTATPELGFNATSESIASGATRNPWNPAHSGGGSSGGAGVAVASGMVPVAHANDGGGSIRIPATVNGLVGLKPSRLRVPVGPDYQVPLGGMGVEFALTRTVRDCALLLDLVCGPEAGAYAYMAPPSVPYREIIRRPPRGLRIGLAPQAFAGTPAPDAAIAALVMKAGTALAACGHHVETIERIPFEAEAFHVANARFWNAFLAAAVQGLGQAFGVEPGPAHFEAGTLACAAVGARLSAIDMEEAFATMARISMAMAAAFAPWDAIVLPPARTTAPLLGHLDQNRPGLTAEGHYTQIFDIYPYTAPLSMTGQPALSLPTGEVNGLPVGIQIAAPMAREDTLLALAADLEGALPWSARRPCVHAACAR
jgi:amidase